MISTKSSKYLLTEINPNVLNVLIFTYPKFKKEISTTDKKDSKWISPVREADKGTNFAIRTWQQVFGSF